MQAVHSPPTAARAPASTRGGPAPSAGLPAASPAQAHQMAPTGPRGQRGGEHLGTSRRDVLLDPARARGEGLAVTSSEAGAPATDGVSTTLLYFQALQEKPYASEAELWTEATRRDYNYGGGVTTFQQPRAAAPSRGEAPAGRGARSALPDMAAPRDNTRLAGRGAPLNRRHALVIGNAGYRSNLKPLPGAKRDAALMAGRFEARGYGVSHLEDLDTAATTSAIRAVGASAQKGDELAIYFAGHGVDGDLTGVDARIQAGAISPRVPASVASGALGAALSSGATLELIIDACESGPLQQQLGRDHDGLGRAAAVDAQGVGPNELRGQALQVDAQTTGTLGINVPDAGVAYDKTFLPSQAAAQQHARAAAARDRPAAAKSGAAKAGGKPSGLGGVTNAR